MCWATIRPWIPTVILRRQSGKPGEGSCSSMTGKSMENVLGFLNFREQEGTRISTIPEMLKVLKGLERSEKLRMLIALWFPVKPTMIICRSVQQDFLSHEAP